MVAAKYLKVHTGGGWENILGYSTFKLHISMRNGGGGAKIVHMFRGVGKHIAYVFQVGL